MKKSLLLSFALLTAALGQAQTLLSDDATAYTVGNVGTDITGATPGQGGWLTTVTAGANSDFQVVNAGGTYGNVIQLTGSNTAVNTRRMYKDVSAIWGTRTAGNDVAQVQFDFYTGAATTSANSFRVILYNTDLTRMLAGLTYIAATRELRGLGYYDNTAGGGAVGNYSFTLGLTGTTFTAVTLAQNTWYTVGFSYNKTTGELKFKELSGTMVTAPSIMGASTGTDLSTLNLLANAISTSGQANTVAATAQFDNVSLRALAADGPLLRVDNPTVAAFSFYPNPADNVVNISTVGNIESVSIADINGRTVRNQKVGLEDQAQIDVSGLTSGVYFMTVEGDSGRVTKKVIKH
ncbi:T9SS type A sorting domain-containing protein [Flavobacterium sp.]|uniref:T9SS type A sorting domain-containing protein n=1 Tax=Flavobacterium sp. TaxID=239 RepID=UPI0025C350D9|nr:T9SS type A sorting domain-containing protein [Flavobacterium sp.]